MISQDFYRPLVFISIICLLSVLQFIIPEFKNHGKKRILINITFFIMGGIFSKVFYLLIGLKVLELPTFFAGLNSLPTYLDILFTVILFDFLLCTNIKK